MVLPRSLLAASMGILPIFRFVVFFSEVCHIVSFLFFDDCFPVVALSLPGVFTMQKLASLALAVNSRAYKGFRLHSIFPRMGIL